MPASDKLFCASFLRSNVYVREELPRLYGRYVVRLIGLSRKLRLPDFVADIGAMAFAPDACQDWLDEKLGDESLSEWKEMALQRCVDDAECLKSFFQRTYLRMLELFTNELRADRDAHGKN